MKLFWSCQTRLKLELKHEFHIVIKFEECLKACHRVIIQGEEEHKETSCARIPFRIRNRALCCQSSLTVLSIPINQLEQVGLSTSASC